MDLDFPQQVGINFTAKTCFLLIKIYKHGFVFKMAFYFIFIVLFYCLVLNRQ